MSNSKTLFYTLLSLGISLLMFTACDNDEEKTNNTTPDPSTTEFTLESPYLVCANRNPGGIGFDFLYEGEKGGADYMDNLVIPNFTYDTKIRTIKCEKQDGSLAGIPFLQLAPDAQAVNYTTIDPTCLGIAGFNTLTKATLKTYTLSSDDSSFNLSSIEVGSTGTPLIEPLMTEMKKLVIGIKWKDTANNEINDDEIVWLIKTGDGQLVKFIVTDFPASPAPSTTGYIAILWDFVQ